MCGIVGLFLKNSALRPELGAHLAVMLGTLGDRGPDSAGFAVFGEPGEGVKLTIHGDGIEGEDLAEIAETLGLSADIHATHAVLHVEPERLAVIRDRLAAMPGVSLVSEGRSMELFKEVGAPERVAARFGLAEMHGSHGIGHTRMATESAVTTDGAHPYSTGPDQCLVHNGSLSNHNAVRRKLQREGFAF